MQSQQKAEVYFFQKTDVDFYLDMESCSDDISGENTVMAGERGQPRASNSLEQLSQGCPAPRLRVNSTTKTRRSGLPRFHDRIKTPQREGTDAPHGGTIENVSSGLVRYLYGAGRRGVGVCGGQSPPAVETVEQAE